MPPRRQPWSEDELTALRQIPPNSRRAIADFRVKFPDRGAEAVKTKLQVLRVRRQAADVSHDRRRDPFPVHRFD